MAALPSVRMVMTAGATTLTTSAYESRPPAIACVMGVVTAAVAVAWLADDWALTESPRHAAPVTRTNAATTASAARLAGRPPIFQRVLFIAGVLSEGVERP